MKQIVIVWIFLVFAIAMVFLLQNNLQKSSKSNSYKTSNYARQSKQAQTYNAPAKPKYDDAEIQRKLRFKAGVTE